MTFAQWMGMAVAAAVLCMVVRAHQPQMAGLIAMTAGLMVWAFPPAVNIGIGLAALVITLMTSHYLFRVRALFPKEEPPAEELP